MSYILAGLIVTGGVVGFCSTGSLPSVIAGLLVGIIYGLGGYRQNDSQAIGIELGLLASILLTYTFLPHAIRRREAAPIMLSAVAMYGVFSFGSAYFKQN